MGWERMQPGCYSNRGWARLCEKKYVLWWQNQMRLGGVVWWMGGGGLGWWGRVRGAAGWRGGGGGITTGADRQKQTQKTQRLDVRPCAGWSELDEFAVSTHKLAFVMLFSAASCVADGWGKTLNHCHHLFLSSFVSMIPVLHSLHVSWYFFLYIFFSFCPHASLPIPLSSPCASVSLISYFAVNLHLF